MKTTLPASITTIAEAKDFLTALHANGESYHPEDNAHEIEWQTCSPTPAECDQLNKLMDDIYNIEGNQDIRNMIFDPCTYLTLLDIDYIKVNLCEGETFTETTTDLIVTVVAVNGEFLTLGTRDMVGEHHIKDIQQSFLDGKYKL